MPGKTILLVDADTASLNFLSNLMRKEGYAVLQTNMGKEGLIHAWRDRPDLVVFDPVLQDLPGEQFLTKLRQDPRSAAIPVLALSSDADPDRKSACLEAGCNEYIGKSGEAVTAIPETLSRLLAGGKPVAKEKLKEGGYLIVFLSAKGGTGVSSLCANYGVAICENKPEARVVVADLVLPIGSIANITGYTGELDLVTVASLPEDEIQNAYFHEQLPEQPRWRFQLLPGSTSPQRANELQAGRIPDIIEALLAAYDFVIVDLGRSLSRISIPIIQRADLLALVVSTDQSTVTLTKTVLDYFQTQGIEEKRIYPILNRVIGLEGLTKADAEKIIGLDIKTTIPYMGSNFVMANNQNQPISVKYPGDTATLVVKEATLGMIELVKQLRYEIKRTP
ncbi:MAG: response regulator [Chloroflexota bacterium]